MRRSINTLLFTIILALLAPWALAGGPFFVDRGGSGVPTRWEGDTVKWVADQGPLNDSIDNAKAVAWVSELFNEWANATLENENGDLIKVSNIKMEYQGTLSKDIGVDNYLTNVFQSNARAVVIFDPKGEIVDEELGAGSRNYVVGFSTPFSNGGAYFVGGAIVINGLFPSRIGEKEFKAAILHEIGHLLNLDHTQANYEAVERYASGDRSLSDEIPTMYPVLYTDDQLTLQTDDVISLVEQYPSNEYLSSFCTISGELRDVNGEGFQGADVVARATEDIFVWSDVRTIVSGVRFPRGTANGTYFMGGIVPNREYVLAFRGIDPNFIGGSSIAPYDPPRSGVISGNISKGIIGCSRGGETIDINNSLVGIDETRATATSGSADGITQEESSAAPSGGCSLIMAR